MQYTITLIAPDISLSDKHRDLVQSHISVTDQKWLSPNKALDLYTNDNPDHSILQTLRRDLEPDKIDIACTRTNNRRKKLLLADMDSTIVTSETLDELADFAGIKDQIALITERAMRGELDFHEALRERVGLLKDLPADTLHKTLESTEISKGADILIKTMRTHGATCVLVSGGFTFFTDAIANRLGFSHNHGNTLEIQDNKLTGRVIDPILDKNAKLTYLQHYSSQFNLSKEQTCAVGDGANDILMLEAADIGFGYRPKPLLEEKLTNLIRFTDLTSILYAQGYTSDEFIA